MSFLYVKKNAEYVGKYKYGYTKNPQRRLHDAHDALSYVSQYIELYEISIHPKIAQNWEFDDIFSTLALNNVRIDAIEQKYNIKLQYLRQFAQYIVRNGGGIEFMRTDGLQTFNDIIKHEFKYFGLTVVKHYTVDEIDAVNNTPRPNKHTDTNAAPFMNDDVMSEVMEEIVNEPIRIIEPTHNVKLRDYQQNIVDELVKTLRMDKRASVDLATGAGKTTVVYVAMALLNPKNIIIVSPRIVLNKQNVGDKYTRMLKRKYNIANYTDTQSYAESNLISTTLQSLNKLLPQIEQLEDVFIWFDESHYAVKAKLDKDTGDCSRLLELDNIAYMCHTSATWDITNMPVDIFGKRIYVISPAELIQQGWLCEPKLRTYEIDCSDVNNAQYIAEQFVKLNRTNGAVFHTTQANAKNLFKNHYDLYYSGETDVVPFIDVGDTYDFGDNEPPAYQYQSIDAYKNTPNSVVYAVQKISMGFDFPKLDFIVFADPRSSHQDIVQVVGRGTRSDCKGEGGRNRDKDLIVMLFTKYIRDDSPYANIKETLRALINEYDIQYDQITIDGYGGSMQRGGKNYEGAKTLESVVYNLYVYKLPPFITTLKRANVFDINSYHKLRDEKEHLDLPYDPFIKHGDKQFCFEMVFDEGTYYTWDEYNLRIRDLLTEYPEYKGVKYRKKIVMRNVHLNKLDEKIPPYDPKKYYGYDY